ncbi:MAG: hypothetical protein JRI86_06095 [Deltaproteobacteria bacterium]|nr:hypothetical protein [Deltaproteobacteria bacterium]
MQDKNPSSATLEGAKSQQGIWPEISRRTPPDERVFYPGEGIILPGPDETGNK